MTQEIKKICLKCKKELELSGDVFSGALSHYCNNNKCDRYGLNTVLYIEQTEATLSEKVET